MLRFIGRMSAGLIRRLSASRRNDREKIFTSYDIQSCLYDVRRVELFQEAIRAVVKPGDVVVDGGSGTGLLGLLAAQAGAARVYCVELNKDYIDVINENAKRNNLQDRIIAIQADATTVRLSEEVDVIISEVISAGFFYEPQLQIVANLKHFLKPGGAVIPYAMENDVQLISAEDKLYGLTFSYDSRFRTLPGDVSLTERATYLKTTFGDVAPQDFGIRETARVVATRDGVANAVQIGYRLQFVEGGDWSSEPTDFLLNPQIVFLDQPVDVVAEQECEIGLTYQASSSPLTSTVTARCVDNPMTMLSAEEERSVKRELVPAPV
ncbi:precorrin-6B methylase 2 [Allocatelliglobosispora scoriae]|uniref:Precorrin-6B methylase 2 n=1 Tax=Allocatelliglobosispora scoriae TaxID=643052 RepID=A0A841BPP4_9ACTN|nr:50S ribosomal protein L11 methyltransferase [Allocatelliglobosispora scoriae]MBB5869655.1 precorrin-6B methylase 2 [Allocatelliglobosispora scoriae]